MKTLFSVLLVPLLICSACMLAPPLNAQPLDTSGMYPVESAAAPLTLDTSAMAPVLSIPIPLAVSLDTSAMAPVRDRRADLSTQAPPQAPAAPLAALDMSALCPQLNLPKLGPAWPVSWMYRAPFYCQPCDQAKADVKSGKLPVRLLIREGVPEAVAGFLPANWGYPVFHWNDPDGRGHLHSGYSGSDDFVRLIRGGNSSGGPQ